MQNGLLRHPAKRALKVIDFGSSCFEHEKSARQSLLMLFVNDDHLSVYTYIQSRFYRSPEVILGMNYHMAIDMWSLGCILAELYTGFPIFPGENEQEQLSCIMEVLGIPDKDFVNRSSRKRLFFGEDHLWPQRFDAEKSAPRFQRRTPCSRELKRPSKAARNKESCSGSALQ